MTVSISPDQIIDLEGAQCQHGPYNRRIYLMNLRDADPVALIPALDTLARANQYTKIFAKVPASKTASFLENGYRQEATVPGFFGGEETASFLGRYFDEARRASKESDLLDAVIESALSKHQASPKLPPLPGGYALRRTTPDDVLEMSRLYQQTFPSYPFPIQDPDYLRETMATHVIYYAALKNGEIVALASSEMDKENRNVEMTDFATAPHHQGQSLAVHLLALMETEMRFRGIACAYTISRAASYPINITFSKLGYDYGGRLINNTNIGGQIESMTVWYKSL